MQKFNYVNFKKMIKFGKMSHIKIPQRLGGEEANSNKIPNSKAIQWISNPPLLREKRSQID